jgi:hypothetical protein
MTLVNNIRARIKFVSLFRSNQSIAFIIARKDVINVMRISRSNNILLIVAPIDATNNIKQLCLRIWVSNEDFVLSDLIVAEIINIHN